jgi:hypothetical protein
MASLRMVATGLRTHGHSALDELRRHSSDAVALACLAIAVVAVVLTCDFLSDLRMMQSSPPRPWIVRQN